MSGIDEVSVVTVESPGCGCIERIEFAHRLTHDVLDWWSSASFSLER